MSIQINSTMTVKRTIAVAQVIPQYRQTEGQGKRRLLTPDEVLRLPNEELLVIIRGRNILRLNKLDYSRLPMAEDIEKVSIMDYEPHPLPTPITELSPERPLCPPTSRTNRKPLYSSATPPTEF